MVEAKAGRQTELHSGPLPPCGITVLRGAVTAAYQEMIPVTSPLQGATNQPQVNRCRSGPRFESQNSLVRSVEVSGQLSNQLTREEINALWTLTRDFA
jgi:hypothetical protein